MTSEAEQIAASLTEAQRSIIIGLGVESAIADVSDIFPPKQLAAQAGRLRKAGLVTSRLNKYESFLLWRLTPLGQQVRAILQGEQSHG
jgi:hypothetical protein